MSDIAESSAPAARLGGELRSRRQSLGWELPELSASLRIRQSYLEAIEAGRMSELPGMTYALGFVRAYASALGLQGEQVAGRFRAESAEANVRPALSFPAPVPQRGVPAGALMLLGLVILGGTYAGWYYVSEHQKTPAETVPPIPDRLMPSAQKATPSPQVASILPTASAPAPAPAVTGGAVVSGVAGGGVAAAGAVGSGMAASGMTGGTVAPPVRPGIGVPGGGVPEVGVPAGGAPGAGSAVVASAPPVAQAAQVPRVVAPGAGAGAVPAGAAAVPAGTRIVIRTTGDAWVTVKQAGGPALYNHLMHAGDSWPVPPGATGLSLTTGNAGATALDVDGTQIATLGGSGAVRRDLKLDADVLKAGPLPPISRGRVKVQ